MRSKLFFLVIGVTCLCTIITAQTNRKLNDLIRKSGFNWHKYESENFVYYIEYNSFADSLIDPIKQQLESERKGLLVFLDRESPVAKNHIFITGTKEKMVALLGFEAQGFTIAEDSIVILLHNASYDLKSRHELCHLFLFQLWGRPASSWTNEGFAVAYDNEWTGYKVDALAKHLKDNQKWYGITRLLKNLYALNSMITYPEIGSFTGFLLKTYGKEKFYRLWRGGSSSIDNIFGKNVKTLEKEWHQFLDGIDVRDINYTTKYGRYLKR